MSDDFNDFDAYTVDGAAAVMQAEIDLDNRQAAAELDAVWVVNWRELDDETAHDVWVDLRDWVEWFTLRYQVSPTVVPDCWWKHGWLVEELSALRSAHRALFDPNDTGLGPIGWHERYALAAERIKKASASSGCTNGHQETRPIRDWSAATDETEWDTWITRAHGAQTAGPA